MFVIIPVGALKRGMGSSVLTRPQHVPRAQRRKKKTY